MRRSILAAASVLALGIGGVGVVHAAPTAWPGMNSSSDQTTEWRQSYGVPATAAQMAKLSHEHLASGQQYAQSGTPRQYAEIGTIRVLRFPGG